MHSLKVSPECVSVGGNVEADEAFFEVPVGLTVVGGDMLGPVGDAPEDLLTEPIVSCNKD